MSPLWLSNLASPKFHIVVIPLILVIHGWWSRNTYPTTRIHNAASNRTLGFEKILTVSKQPGWRTIGLLAAANLTGLDVTIPTQPLDPPEIVAAFANLGSGELGVRRPKYGSTLAWLAHLDMIKFVIASGLSSALILEDDVDWDVDILRQMQLVSTHIRNFTNVDRNDGSPYGSNWDILWLGHCGERSNLEVMNVLYRDDTRVDVEKYSGWSKKYWMNDIPAGHRRIQKAVNPICTFAYALNKGSAQKVLTAVGGGADEAWDVALQHQCVMGNLRCLVVTPQLFNHHEPSKESGYISFVNEGDGRGTSTMSKYVGGTTANVVHSARCKALFNDTCLAPPTAPDFYDAEGA